MQSLLASEMWGNVGTCGEMWGNVGKCGEVGNVGKCGVVILRTLDQLEYV